MKVLLAGGGTAGHINPALAIAGYIKQKRPDTEFLFIGNADGMEQRLVAQAGYPIESIAISGFKRGFAPKDTIENIKTVKRAISSTQEAKKIIKKFKPDLCIGTGGYVSGPVVKAASKLGVTCLIHEQNAYPGVTNKLLRKRVKKVMVAVEAAKKYFADVDTVVTGNPVREEILTADKAECRKKLGLDQRPVVLSFGGSLGAQKVNEAMADFIARSGKDGRYQHIHAYGKFGEWFPGQAMGKPAILIPSPNVAENHQYHNAMALVDAGAADIIEEKDLTGELLIKKADAMLSDPKVLEEYTENSKKMAIVNANERIYSVIKKVVGN